MSPVSPAITGPSAAATGSIQASVAGTPTFLVNTYFNITSSNDILKLSPNDGSTLTIDIDDGLYSPTALTAELVTKYAAATASAAAIISAYNASTYKFSITAGTGETVKYLDSGSDGGDTWGFTADTAAALTITSDTPTESSGNLTFTFAQNDNVDVVEYSIYDVGNDAWVNNSTGATGAATVWATYSAWSTSHAGTVTITGLTTYTGYQFAILTRNESEEQAAFSATSATMYSHVNIDYGDVSSELSREITSGQTKIELGGGANSGSTLTVTGTNGAIACELSLVNNFDTTSSVHMLYSEDNSTYNNALSFYQITADNATLRVNTDSAGATQSVILTSATYTTGTTLASHVETRINANATLTNSGAADLSVAYSSSTGKYSIDAGGGHTVNIEHFDYGEGSYLIGFTDDVAATQVATSNESRGESPYSLSTSATGVVHTIYWDSYEDSGRSEFDESVYLRQIPYDETNANNGSGSVGATETSQAFTVDNRPATTTVTNFDTFEFDEDTTPQFTFTMRTTKGGSKLYPKIIVYDINDNPQFTRELSTGITGWMYQQSGGTYTDTVITGIPAEYIDGTNKVRYTVQSDDGLTAANKKAYAVTIHQGEIRDRG